MNPAVLVVVSALTLAGVTALVAWLAWASHTGRLDRIHRYQITPDTPAYLSLSLADRVAEGLVACVRHPDRTATHVVSLDGADVAVCGPCLLDLAGPHAKVTATVQPARKAITAS